MAASEHSNIGVLGEHETFFGPGHSFANTIANPIILNRRGDADGIGFFSRIENEMHDVAIYVKSFAPDFFRLKLLIDSWRVFASSIPLLISVPAADMPQARLEVGSADITLIADEDYTEPSKHPHFYGWLHQQVCKLNSFRSGFAHCYFMVDSDCYFIRPMTKKDLIDPSGINYSLISNFSPNCTQGDKRFIDFVKTGQKTWTPWQARQSDPEIVISDLFQYMETLADPSAAERGPWIPKIFGNRGNPVLQPCPIVNSAALQSLRDEFCIPNGLSLSDLIAISPWEFHWYGEWLIFKRPIPLITIDPLVAHFSTEENVRYFLNEGLTEEDLAKRFFAVAMGARHFERLKVGLHPVPKTPS